MFTRAAGLVLVSSLFCAPEAHVKGNLENRFGEELRQSETVRGYEVEQWVNHETESWTLIVIADGQACVLAAGKGWHGKPIGASWFPMV